MERTGTTTDILDSISITIKSLKGSILKDIKEYSFLKLAESYIPTNINIEDAKICDEIFCEYLKAVGKVTNSEYLGNVIKFIILYRECINKYGWLKFGKRLPSVREDSKEKEYTSMNNAEFIPELANELVLSYLPEHNYVIPMIDCINLTVNLCEWLINNGFTCMKTVSLKK